MGRLHGSGDSVLREYQHELGSENGHPQRKYAPSPIYGESDPSHVLEMTREKREKETFHIHTTIGKV